MHSYNTLLFSEYLDPQNENVNVYVAEINNPDIKLKM